MPVPKGLLSRLMAFDRTERLVSPGDRILIAVSGGQDSVCLAHHLARLSRPRRLRLTILHMHHGLRAEADGDAAFVERLARQLDVPVIQRRLKVLESARTERRSLEDAARRLRYKELASVARRLGCNKVATGHQLDDQAETVLMHLLRGTKAKGLAGIPPKRGLIEGGARGAAIEVIRPLLALRRSEVRDYLSAYGLGHRKDAHNRSDRFTRSWVRSEVVPLLARRNPRIREHLAAIAADIRRREKY